MFEYHQQSPQVHFAVLAAWVSLAGNNLKKARAGLAADGVFWVRCPAHAEAGAAAAVLSLSWGTGCKHLPGST